MRFFKSNRPEKRKSDRCTLSLNAKFKIISGENPSEISSELSGVVTNLSHEGLSLDSGFVQIGYFHISHDSSMMKKNKLGIMLQFPQEDKNKSPESIYILGEVIWYNKENDNIRYPYHIGVKSLDISEDDKPKLEALISNS